VSLANSYNVAAILKPLFDYVIPPNATINDLLPGKDSSIFAINGKRMPAAAPAGTAYGQGAGGQLLGAPKRKSFASAPSTTPSSSSTSNLSTPRDLGMAAATAASKKAKHARTSLRAGSSPLPGEVPLAETTVFGAVARENSLEMLIDRHRTTLMAVFLNEDPEPLARVDPSFEQHVDLDMDDQGHSALHW
jgi:hypothetical protein